MIDDENLERVWLEKVTTPATLQGIRKLMRFYGVGHVIDLVSEQAHHIEKLQGKLPPLRDEQPRKGAMQVLSAINSAVFRCKICGMLWRATGSGWSVKDAAQKPKLCCDNHPGFFAVIEPLPNYNYDADKPKMAVPEPTAEPVPAAVSVQREPAEDLREYLPVAWAYVNRYNGEETLTRQPPDRIAQLGDYTYTPLYSHNR